MSALVAAGIIGGAGLLGTLAGGALSSSASSKAAKAELAAAGEARDFRSKKVNIGQLWQLAQTVGGRQALEQLKPFLEPKDRDLLFGRPAKAGNFTDEDRASLANVEKEIEAIRRTPAGTSAQGNARNSLNHRLQELQTQRQALLKKAEGDPGQTALLNEEEIAKIPGAVGEYGQLADEAGRTRLGNLSGYDAATSDLDRQARDIERYARDYGTQERARINRDSARALTDNNRAATSALMGRGLGASSVLSDAYRGNTESNQRAIEDALGNLADRQLQVGTSLKTGRLGLLSSRAAGRDAMNLAGQDTERGLRLGALNFKTGSTVGNAAMNPWLGENITQYFPSASPSAASAATWGSALGSMGSTMTGYGFGSLLGNLGRSGTTTGAGMNSTGVGVNGQQLQNYMLNGRLPTN